MKLRRYNINGQIIETTNLKKEYPQFFKTYSYVFEMNTGKTYLFVNDYEYRKRHPFNDTEREFLISNYGETLRGLGLEERVVPKDNLENGMYNVNRDGSVTPIEF